MPSSKNGIRVIIKLHIPQIGANKIYTQLRALCVNRPLFTQTTWENTWVLLGKVYLVCLLG